MADPRLLSIRTKAFSNVKKALASFGFKWAGDKGYLFFKHPKFYLRLEDFDGERVTAYASPIDVFDRWSNSRHFQFIIWVNPQVGTIKNPTRKVRTTLPRMKSWLKIVLGTLFNICKEIDHKHFNCGVSIRI